MKSLTIAVSVAALGFLAAALVLPASGKPQPIQSAPTVAQCQTDQKLWLAKLEDPSPLALSEVTIYKLRDWEGEMDYCRVVDPKNEVAY